MSEIETPDSLAALHEAELAMVRYTRDDFLNDAQANFMDDDALAEIANEQSEPFYDELGEIRDECEDEVDEYNDRMFDLEFASRPD